MSLQKVSNLEERMARRNARLAVMKGIGLGALILLIIVSSVFSIFAGREALRVTERTKEERIIAQHRTDATIAAMRAELSAQLANHDKNIERALMEHEKRQQVAAERILAAAAASDYGSVGGNGTTTPKPNPPPPGKPKPKPPGPPGPPECLPVPLICIPRPGNTSIQSSWMYLLLSSLDGGMHE